MQISPESLFPGYSFDSGEIRIPIDGLTGLTDDETNAETGNGMEIIRQIVEKASTTISALAPTARPTKATIAKPNPSIASGPKVSPGTLRQTYTLTFDLQPTSLELVAEPTL